MAGPAVVLAAVVMAVAVVRVRGQWAAVRVGVAVLRWLEGKRSTVSFSVQVRFAVFPQLRPFLGLK